MFLRLIKSILNLGVIWTSVFVGNLCLAQIAIDEKPGKEAFAWVNTFISSEEQALEGLRNGTLRLERLCAAPLKPLADKASAQGLASLRQEVQERAVRLQAFAERSVSLTQFNAEGALQVSQQACSPINRFKALLGTADSASAPTCEHAKAALTQATALHKAAKDWLTMHQERQRLFSKLMQLESAGCTRTGFAQRMVQTHEQLLGSHESQALELFELALRKNAPTPESKP